MKIIGFLGISQSGKDTAFDMLGTMKNKKVLRIAFADPIKDGSMALCGFTKAQCTVPSLKNKIDERYGFCPRDVFEAIGESMRQLNLSFFHVRLKFVLDEHMSRMSDTDKEKLIVILTDVRYPDEITYVREQLGGTVIGIRRAGNVAKTKSDKQVNYDLADKIIENDGTLREFITKIAEYPDFQ